MIDTESYLLNVKVKLATSRAIQSIEIIDEKIVLSDRGYFRARLSLVNGDFLEIAEYFIWENGECFPKTYRYQWMDQEQKQSRKRWDNAEHFPNLSGFPHHIHIDREDNVKPFKPLSILDLLDIIEREIDGSRTV